jgi:hypothetical protein
MAPYTMVRFNPHIATPARPRFLHQWQAPRTVNFLPRHLHDLQAQNRADQQDPTWRRLYASRSGIEGTLCQWLRGTVAADSSFVAAAGTGQSVGQEHGSHGRGQPDYAVSRSTS